MAGPTNVRVTDGTAVPPRPSPATLALLFTDIEGSTRLLIELGDTYGAVLTEHRALLGAVMARHGGRVFGTEGDAIFVSFADASSAMRAAADAQLALADHVWPGGRELRVRMGIHAGYVLVSGDEYVGLPLHQVARVSSAAHGGQVLVSAAARELAGTALPEGLDLVDLGVFRLKDLTSPEHLFELRIGGLERSFPPPRTIDARPNNLPIQLTSFIGRGEVEAARGLLARTRLLTLTGPGGTGKTRLALQLAAEVVDDYPDGVYFVGLDAVVEVDFVSSAIAASLGIETGSAPPLDRVLVHLRSRRILLVLDNFEQIVDAAPVVTRLLTEAPGVKAIVTSRVLLHASGEQAFAVPPLGLPRVEGIDGVREPMEASSPIMGTGGGSGRGAIGAADAARFEAVQLFVERAAAAMPSFELSDANASAVAEIVMRLDGLPLAIELAAARVRVLPVDALRVRLVERLGVLVGGPRDRPARQQTLRGAIDWSYDLLDEPDRRLFERFAVFAGGACLSQVEAVCGPAAEIGRDPLEGLASLADKSLLRPVPVLAAEPRFTMLATIREYALERLVSAGSKPELRARHAAAYLALAERAAGAPAGAEGAASFDRLEIDHDNLRAAIDWAIEDGTASNALRFLVALWRFWQVRGHLHEADRTIRRIFAMPGVDTQPALLRARALGAAGSVAYWRGAFAETHRRYFDALDLARESGDPATIAEALYNAGFAPTPDGVLDPQYEQGSVSRFLEAQAIYRELGDLRGLANASWALATSAIGTRDLKPARRWIDEAHDAYRKLGDLFGVGWALHELGLIALFELRYDEALRHFQEALAVFRGSADVSAMVVLLLDFVSLAKARGDLDRFWRLAGAADALRVRTGTELAAATGPALGLEVPTRPVDDPAGARAWDEGASLSVEDALALAAGESPPT